MAPCPQQASHPDDFAASRAQLATMIAHLGGEHMMGCTQEALEDYLTETGRELQRRLMQDQLDTRARRASVTGSDGVVRVRTEHGHPRAHRAHPHGLRHRLLRRRPRPVWVRFFWRDKKHLVSAF